MIDANTKQRLIDEFCSCLDDWDGAEADGADQAEIDPPVNLALLFSELAVLRNEVRVEARQFKTALDEMRGVTQLLDAQNQRLTRELERARDNEGQAQRQTERRLLLDLIDVRDRIDAAVAAFKAHRPGWLARLAPAEGRLTQGLGQGIELTLRRLDDALGERRVRAIEAVGGRHDPNTMRVVGVENRPERAAGEVLSQARRGYLRDEELLRLAEVIVNKPEIES